MDRIMDAMKKLLLKKGGKSPSAYNASSKGTKSSKYQQLSVELERLKFENKALKSRVSHLETIFDKKKDKTEMDKHINLLSSLFYQIKIAKRESGIDKKLGKNKLKDEVKRLYNLLKQAKEDCLSKMDQLVEADLRFEKERNNRYKLLDEMTHDRKVFIALLREDRKRYISTLQRVQDGGELVVINEKLVFGMNAEDTFNTRRKKNRHKHKRKGRRPKSSERRRNRNQQSVTRMRDKKRLVRPHTAGKLGSERPTSAGNSNRPKSGPAIRVITRVEESALVGNRQTYDQNVIMPLNSKTQNDIVNSYQVPESPSNQIKEELIASSGEVNLPLEPRPPKRPVRVGPKERAGGIRRRIIAGPNRILNAESNEEVSPSLSKPVQDKEGAQYNNSNESDTESVKTEESEHVIKMPLTDMQVSTDEEEDTVEDTDATSGDDSESEAEEEGFEKDSINKEGATDKTETLAKGNDETRAALPTLGRPKHRERRTRREAAYDQVEETNVGKIFPVTP